jgi:hypothetical protein
MTFTKVAKFIAGTFAFVATTIAIIQGFREYRPPVPKLQAAIINLEHISARTEIPDVKISLAFKGQPVPDFWLCRVRFQNTGGITLYTAGPRPNTQGSILVSIPPEYEILQIEPKGIDPKNSGFEAQIRQHRDEKGVADKSQFEVTFEQWRKDEAIEAVLYLAGPADHLDKPKLLPKGRPILDGDVVPADFSTIAAPEAKTHVILLDRWFSPTWALILRILGIITIGLTGPYALSGRSLFPVEWQRQHAVLATTGKLIALVGFYAALFALVP